MTDLYGPRAVRMVSAALFAPLFVGTLSLFSWIYLYHSVPLESGIVTIIDARGAAYQNDKRVAWALPTGSSGEPEITLFVADPKIEYDSPFYSRIELPAPVEVAPGATFQSIQGIEGMSVATIDNSTLQAQIVGLLPESHTSFKISFPEGYVALPWYIRLTYFLAYLPFAYGLITGFLMVVGAWAYYAAVGRSVASGKQAASPVPPMLSPLEMAVLMKGELRAEDLSAHLYSLASMGRVQVMQNQGESYFLRTSMPANLKPYEESILSLLTQDSSKPSSLHTVLSGLTKQIFSRTVGEVYAQVYGDLQGKGFFEEGLPVIHLRFKTAAIILQFVSLIAIAIMYALAGTHVAGAIVVALAGYLCAIILYRSGYRIVPLTELGHAEWERCQAFIGYLRLPELLPIDHGGMDLFYTYLPYALVSNSVEEWFARFEHDNFLIPGWFSADRDYFYPLDFITQVESVGKQFSEVFVSAKDPNVD